MEGFRYEFPYVFHALDLTFEIAFCNLLAGFVLQNASASLEQNFRAKFESKI